FSERRHQPPPDSFSLIVLAHGNIVDEQLRRLRPCHRQRVGGDAADNLVACIGGKRPELIPAQQAIEVTVRKGLACLFEHLGHHDEKISAQRLLTSGQPFDSYVHGRCLLPPASRRRVGLFTTGADSTSVLMLTSLTSRPKVSDHQKM